MLVGLGVFGWVELEATVEDSDFWEAAESDACSLMEVSRELSPESFEDAEARIRWDEVNDRIGGNCRLGLQGHSLGGGSLKGFIIFRASS